MATRPPPYDEFYGKPCPYRLACPHLQGQNVQTLWQHHQQLLEENRQVHQRNEQLVKELHDAHVRCAQLEGRHRRQFKASRATPDPCSQKGVEKVSVLTKKVSVLTMDSAVITSNRGAWPGSFAFSMRARSITS